MRKVPLSIMDNIFGLIENVKNVKKFKTRKIPFHPNALLSIFSEPFSCISGIYSGLETHLPIMNLPSLSFRLDS